jgi:hypothetical protein
MILVLTVLIFLCLPISNRKTDEWASANVRAIQETKTRGCNMKNELGISRATVLAALPLCLGSA